MTLLDVEFVGGPLDGQKQQMSPFMAGVPYVYHALPFTPERTGPPEGFYLGAEDGKRLWQQRAPDWWNTL